MNEIRTEKHNIRNMESYEITITKSDKINVKIDDKSLIYLLNSALRYDTTNRLYDSLNPTFNTLDNVLPPLKSMRI